MDELGSVGSVTETSRERGIEPGGLANRDRDAITNAADRVDANRVSGAAMRVAGEQGDTLENARRVNDGAAVGALQYGRIDPTNGRGINGGTYTPKVEQQMRLSPTGAIGDRYHGFPSAVDDAARGARSTPFVSGDGQIRSLTEVPGNVNGKPGNFEYITNRDGSINHRNFAQEGKSIVPHEARIPGTNLLRGVGRVAAPLGAAMDAYDVATSPTPVKTAVEKAAGWGGAAAAASIVGSAATPLLAGGIPGAIGYGALVLGSGVAGYFGGEAAARTALGWLGF